MRRLLAALAIAPVAIACHPMGTGKHLTIGEYHPDPINLESGDRLDLVMHLDNGTTRRCLDYGGRPAIFDAKVVLLVICEEVDF